MPAPQSLALQLTLVVGLALLSDPRQRYATVGLRAAGAAANRPVRWFVDGQAHPGVRWALERGRHRIRALDGSGIAAEVDVAVE